VTTRRRRTAGAALLAAMLTVALVATFAAAALWQQWRSTEVEAAERARVQSAWILTGALDWARLLLREDGRTPVDHLGEPWAVPLQEARLSSFLAADRNATAETGPDVLEAFLSGQIVDMQSLLNVNTLVDDSGKPSPADVRSFQRLFELLGLPPAQLDLLVENMRFAADASSDNRSAPMAPLLPQKVEELVWLGLPVATVAALQPYVTVLPARQGTPVNLNTAPAEVIYAAVDGLSMADAQRLVAVREQAPFRSVPDARNAIGAPEAMFAFGQVHVAIATNFFEVRARLRLDQLVVEERSLVKRDGIIVTTLQRERGIADPTALSQAAARR
jgi:general secretion pathway protein K